MSGVWGNFLSVNSDLEQGVRALQMAHRTVGIEGLFVRGLFIYIVRVGICVGAFFSHLFVSHFRVFMSQKLSLCVCVCELCVLCVYICVCCV